MDTFTLMALILTLTLVVATFLAWRQGNERRDVGLLGILSGVGGLATAAAWAV